MRNSSVGYGDREIIHGVSILARKGNITCLIGHNGAGKSTLLKAICGFLKPKTGKIVYLGDDITGCKPNELAKKGVSYVFQERTIFPYLTVEDNLEMGTWSLEGKSQKAQAINDAYNMFPLLKERSGDRATVLSRGMQRMLEIARGICGQPRLLIIDEPTAGLAPKVAIEVYERLLNLKDLGITILFVDQNVRKGVEIADYVYVLELGRVKLEGRGKDFKNRLESLAKTWFAA